MSIETTHVDVPGIQEVFADTVRMVGFTGSELRIELAVTRLDEPKPPKPPTGRTYTAGRLVLTPAAAMQLHSNLTNVVAMLEKQGLVQKNPIAPPPPPAAAH